MQLCARYLFAAGGAAGKGGSTEDGGGVGLEGCVDKVEPPARKRAYRFVFQNKPPYNK